MPDKDESDPSEQTTAATESPDEADGADAPEQADAEQSEAAATEPEAAATQPAPEEKAKQSPAEAFAEMRDTVTQLRIDVTELFDFTKVARDKLLKEADDFREEGLKPVLDAMIRLHTLVFRRVIAMEAGAERPDEFTYTLFKAIDGEFVSLGIDVVRPQPGDEVDLELMNTLGMVPCPFWRKPDRVAQVNSCGFVLNMDSGQRVIKKAEITVYRK